MRLLIAGGGTGGHIYPALAVARSLRARPDAPDIAWLGGHRGLEAHGPEQCYVTGTPIRDLRDVDREAARARFDVPAGERLLLVFGGSQAVRRFNGAVAEALPRLVERVHVVHVTGDDGYPAALAAREALPAAVRDRYRPYPFLRDEMVAALAAADLVVGRAGSSTLAEVTAHGLQT